MSGKGIDNSPAQVPGNDGGYVIVVALERWDCERAPRWCRRALALRALRMPRCERCRCPAHLRSHWPVWPPLNGMTVMRSSRWVR